MKGGDIGMGGREIYRDKLGESREERGKGIQWARNGWGYRVRGREEYIKEREGWRGR
jgi:hypothetical protein